MRYVRLSEPWQYWEDNVADFDMPASGTWSERGGWVVKRLAADLGLTPEQAAGIVGNIGFESAGFTKLHEVGQPEGVGGYGWAQWTADRRVAYLAWCNANNLDWRGDEANYRYLLVELKGAYKRSVDALKQMGTVEAAVFSFGQTYERPGGTTPSHLPGYEGRLSYAERALAGAGGAAVPDEPDPVEVAVRALQAALHVGVDGDPGPQTLGALAAWRAGRY